MFVAELWELGAQMVQLRKDSVNEQMPHEGTQGLMTWKKNIGDASGMGDSPRSPGPTHPETFYTQWRSENVYWEYPVNMAG